jgi:hypothetical protein
MQNKQINHCLGKVSGQRIDLRDGFPGQRMAGAGILGRKISGRERFHGQRNLCPGNVYGKVLFLKKVSGEDFSRLLKVAQIV